MSLETAFRLTVLVRTRSLESLADWLLPDVGASVLSEGDGDGETDGEGEGDTLGDTLGDGVGDGDVLGDGDALCFRDGEQLADGFGVGLTNPGVGIGLLPLPVTLGPWPCFAVCAGFDSIDDAACWIVRGSPERAKPPATATTTTAAITRAGLSHA